MRRFIVALGVLLAYMAVDAGLTTIGLKLGLREGNSYALQGFIPHVLVATLSLAARRVEEYLNLRHVTHMAVTLLTCFYGYVLMHNLFTIWRYGNV